MLEVTQATTTLGKQSFNFSLSVAANEILVVIGESGSGKSTLLNMINGFVPVESGDIRWDGKSLLPLSVRDRPVATLFQKNNLFEHLCARDNIGLGIDPGLKLTGKDRDNIEQALEQVGLGGFGERMPGQLSGGEQQRVALARALIMTRPVLLLDEPYSALDSVSRRAALELTQRLSEEKQLCTVVVTHNPDDAGILGAKIVEVSERGDHLMQSQLSAVQVRYRY